MTTLYLSMIPILPFFYFLAHAKIPSIHPTTKLVLGETFLHGNIAFDFKRNLRVQSPAIKIVCNYDMLGMLLIKDNTLVMLLFSSDIRHQYIFTATSEICLKNRFLQHHWLKMVHFWEGVYTVSESDILWSMGNCLTFKLL